MFSLHGLRLTEPMGLWDNAAMESFFSSLKTERTARKVYRTRDDAIADVFDYIERFYNPKRRHSKLGYLSPMEFENKVGLAQLGVRKAGSRPRRMFSVKHAREPKQTSFGHSVQSKHSCQLKKRWVSESCSNLARAPLLFLPLPQPGALPCGQPRRLSAGGRFDKSLYHLLFLS